MQKKFVLRDVFRLWWLGLMLTGLSQVRGQSSTDTTFQTHYETYGVGRPVLIINGGPGMSSKGFSEMAKKISELSAQVIVYDQRGTGQSVPASGMTPRISMDLMVEDIENLRKKLNISSWVVLGHSFGGMLATKYAHQHPGSVEGLIFSSSGGTDLRFLTYIQARIDSLLGPEAADSLRYYNQILQADNKNDTLRKKRALCLAKAYVYDDRYAPLIAERLLQVNVSVNALVFEDLQKAGYDYNNKFSDFKQPVLILQGEKDIISMETAENIKRTFTNAQLIKLPNCGHYGWLEQEARYLDAVNNYLKQL